MLTFSDLQADIARDLIKAGVPVYAFNQRSIDDTLGMVETIGRLVGAEDKALRMVTGLEAQIEAARTIAAERIARSGRSARAFISKNGTSPTSPPCSWVSELIEIAGGENIFADRAQSPLARDRILADPLEVVAARPRHHHRLVVRQALPARARFLAAPAGLTVPAVVNGRLHEIKSAIILTPGPVAISEGLPLLLDIFDL